MQILAWILVGGLVLFAVSCAPSFKGRADDFRPPATHDELVAHLKGKSRPAILFVGNSYSFGVPKAFKKHAASQGRKVRVGHSVHGGWTLARHAAHEPTLDKIRNGNWDVVVLQEQSQLPSMPESRRDREMIPAVRKLADAAREAGAVPMLYQTWGRLHGDRDNERFFPDDTFEAMHVRLATGYQAAAKSAGGLTVIPVGDAWAEEVAAGRGEALFVEDGSHPSAAGNALTARVAYEMLFPSR